ncbi:HAD family hydrolase [Cohnella abietis]|uniref:Phosphoglycolate phosphatase n=1 Tax=Cohnella abietis TaxID=2507935 RepID=A0A3T1D0T9_9BACL|nr:HAD-IA family hydrolase [Cohnella abietis]BBI31723.1 phosphoglycolate phosphatase [Cohnella abietis]
MTIKAVIFDFDGTLMDTETSAYDAYCGIYSEYGHTFALDAWAVGIGTQGNTFDPYADLERLTGNPVNRKELKERYLEAHEANIAKLVLLPGVLARLEEARKLGLMIGLASSSDRAWIERHLTKQGIREYFQVIKTSNDVERVKPDPALYRLVVEGLGVQPHEAMAFEDSLHGLSAAKAAGLFGIAVPNLVTAKMDFSAADLIMSSMEQRSLEEIIVLLDSK